MRHRHTQVPRTRILHGQRQARRFQQATGIPPAGRLSGLDQRAAFDSPGDEVEAVTGELQVGIQAHHSRVMVGRDRECACRTAAA